MSFAIPIGGPHFHGYGHYPSASNRGHVFDRMWNPQGSATDWSPVIDAALVAIQTKCAEADWDGDEALPISDRTINIVAQVARSLFALVPTGTPVPDFIPERDGEICITWSIDADRVFSISIGEYGKINFAGQFGKGGALHAWQPINPKSLISLENSLQDVARYIAKLYTPLAA